MRQYTVLELFNRVRAGLNDKQVSAISSETEHKLVLTALNEARGYLFEKGRFACDEYWGTLITVDGKITYDPTPPSTNYSALSRSCSDCAVSHSNAVPMQAASFDDTYNMSKVTGTGSNPSITKVSIGTLNSGRISASVWLKASADFPPGTVTLTITDLINQQPYTVNVTVGTTIQRYGISGYFNASSTGVRFKVSWPNATGVVYIDGWQIEKNDWVSEFIQNDTTDTPQPRVVFAPADSIMGLTYYAYNQFLNWNQILLYDPTLYPSDHSQWYQGSDPFYSNNGDKLTLNNIPTGTHLIYRSKQAPPLWGVNDADMVVTLPESMSWILSRGAIAYRKSARYDIGANPEASTPYTAWRAQVEELIQENVPSPGWGFLNVIGAKIRT